MINDAPRVKPETRESVTAAIEALGFRPNRSAQALGTGRARSVTVVASDTVLHGPAVTIRGIERAARRAGRTVGIRVLDASSDADAATAVDDLADGSSGLVVVIAFDAAGYDLLRRLPAHIPAVAALDPGFAVPPGRVGFSLDERSAAAAATRHLLDLGHRTVHHVALPSESGKSGRQAGWRDALGQAGIRAPAPLASGWLPLDARDVAARLVALRPRPTAVLCGNDDVALGLRRGLHEAGLDVPRDVSLVGFDDVPAAAVAVPSLTTVSMPFEALGRALVEAVTGQANPGLPPVPELIVRESTAPPLS